MANLDHIILAVILMVLLFTACGALAAPSPVAAQLEHGAPIYHQGCATSQCHGTDGQGRLAEGRFEVWPLIGDDFQQRHPNAQVVFDVIRSGGEPGLRKLTDQDIYDAIAYQLSLNQIELSEPLTGDTAASTFGGEMQGEVGSGLFPPAADIRILAGTASLTLPRRASSDSLRLRLDQLAYATAIGGQTAPSRGSFVILVLALEALTDGDIVVSPQFLRLTTSQGTSLEPAKTGIRSAIETFHDQVLQPDHGTAVLVVFTLPPGATLDRLVYDDGSGNSLSLGLQP